MTGGYDWTARLWDARSGAELRRFLGHRGAVYGVAVGARVLATGSYARGAAHLTLGRCGEGVRVRGKFVTKLLEAYPCSSC